MRELDVLLWERHSWLEVYLRGWHVHLVLWHELGRELVGELRRELGAHWWLLELRSWSHLWTESVHLVGELERHDNSADLHNWLLFGSTTDLKL